MRATPFTPPTSARMAGPARGGGRAAYGGGGGYGGGYGGGGLGGRLTRTGRTLLLLYGSIYVVELVLTYWMGVDVRSALALPGLSAPQGTLTRPWTLVTHHFIQPPESTLGVLFTALAIYFFAGPLEDELGRRGFLRWWVGVAVGAAVFGQLLSLVPVAPLRSLFDRDLFMGITPGVVAMVATFGLIHPNAQILLFFVLPIRAIWITYLTVGGVAVAILTRSGAEPFYLLGGLVTGYLLHRGGMGRADPRLLWLRYKQWRLQRKLGRFKVIDGGRREDRQGPTYH